MEHSSVILDIQLTKLIRNIKKSQNLENSSHNVVNGAELGNGYSSKKYIVTLKQGGKQIEYFLKCYPVSKKIPIYINMFKNETGFYEEVYPIFHNFELKHKIKDPLLVAKYFNIGNEQSDEHSKPILLENLKLSGFTLREGHKDTTDDHMLLALKTYAKLHAISYAVKWQEPNQYKKIVNRFIDVFPYNMKQAGVHKTIESLVKSFIEKLSPEEDIKILDACDGLPAKLGECLLQPCSTEYSVLVHGDAWSNNQMVKYDDSGKPSDLRLIDFQLTRESSPASDLSYYFYCTANKDMLNNLDYYLNKYYKYLHERIEELGCDPKELYSFENFKNLWKEHCTFGLALSFCVIKLLLYEKEEVPEYAKDLENENPNADIFSSRTKNQDKYQERMKNIVLHFIDHKFL